MQGKVSQGAKGSVRGNLQVREFAQRCEEVYEKCGMGAQGCKGLHKRYHHGGW